VIEPHSKPNPKLPISYVTVIYLSTPPVTIPKFFMALALTLRVVLITCNWFISEVKKYQKIIKKTKFIS
jgi:hypothetical protein